jgi:hypothetical protein
VTELEGKDNTDVVGMFSTREKRKKRRHHVESIAGGARKTSGEHIRQTLAKSSSS